MLLSLLCQQEQVYIDKVKFVNDFESVCLQVYFPAFVISILASSNTYFLLYICRMVKDIYTVTNVKGA